MHFCTFLSKILANFRKFSGRPIRPTPVPNTSRNPGYSPAYNYKLIQYILIVTYICSSFRKNFAQFSLSLLPQLPQKVFGWKERGAPWKACQGELEPMGACGALLSFLLCVARTEGWSHSGAPKRFLNYSNFSNTFVKLLKNLKFQIYMGSLAPCVQNFHAIGRPLNGNTIILIH